MAVPFDQRSDLIWFDGKLIPTADCKISVLTHGLHYASCVFEGERAYGGEIFQRHRAFGAPQEFGQDPRFRNSLQRRRDRRRQAPGSGKEQPEGSLCPADRLARLRGARRLGAEQQDPPRRRHLGMAELFRPGAAPEGHPARSRRIPPPRSEDGALPRQGRRALYDLHDLEAPCRTARLCRCHDARLARPRRRMHRRQHLFRQGRQDPHADRRLLPRRHHARDRDGAGAPAQYRSDRAPHHARRAVRLLRMLHHRHRRRGDGRLRNRRLEIHARPHHPSLDETTTPPKCSRRARPRRRNGHRARQLPAVRNFAAWRRGG